MKHITTEDALRALEEAVAEKGEDYVYQRAVIPDTFDDDDNPATMCAYVSDGAPSCLVGHALHRLGVPLSLMVEHEGDAAIEFINELPGDRTAFEALDAAQARQDEGETWGEALAAARKAVES